MREWGHKSRDGSDLHQSYQDQQASNMEKNNTNPQPTPEEDQELELVLDPKQLEQNKEVRSMNSYRWANIYDTAEGDMATLSEDISEFSIYEAGEKVLKSHIFSALGCALFEGTDFIVWIDWPLQLVQKHAEKRVSNRVYWGTTIKSRKYDYLYFEGNHFGLSPAMQSFRIKSDKHLREYGLVLKEATFPFTEDHWEPKIRYLELEVDKANERWTKAKLKKWLAIAETGGDRPTNEEQQETIETDLALRMKEDREDEY